MCSNFLEGAGGVFVAGCVIVMGFAVGGKSQKAKSVKRRQGRARGFLPASVGRHPF